MRRGRIYSNNYVTLRKSLTLWQKNITSLRAPEASFINITRVIRTRRFAVRRFYFLRGFQRNNSPCKYLSSVLKSITCKPWWQSDRSLNCRMYLVHLHAPLNARTSVRPRRSLSRLNFDVDFLVSLSACDVLTLPRHLATLINEKLRIKIK